MADASGPVETGGSRTRVQRNPHVVAQRMETATVLVHMSTNRIYELNATAGRLWELLENSADTRDIQKQMLKEFDIDATSLAREIAVTVAHLAEQELVIISLDGSGTS